MSQLPTKGFDYDGLPRSFVRASRKRVKRIAELDKETGRNVVEMGKLLKEQREAFGSITEKKQLRGAETWAAWTKQECGLTVDYTNRLIKISDKFDQADTAGSLGFEIMRQLATDSTPQELVDKVVEMAKNGELPTIKQVRDMKKAALQDARPTPTDAKAKAKETGEVVIGSDDRIYTPLPEDQAEQYQERRDRTYGALDAINEIAGLEVEPEQWLKEADTHWLNDFDLRTVESAAGWLNKLIDTYKRDRRIIENG